MQLLLKLSDISVAVGTTAIFAGANLKIHAGDKIAVTGRNGAGKSTLARLIAGVMEQDSGLIHRSGAASIGYLQQEVNADGYETLGDFACADLPQHEAYKVDRAAAGLGFAPETVAATASGGERRKAALARLLSVDPDLMILDEPTNHLDIRSVQWLEERLREASSACLLISHDRALLNAVSERTVWLEDGKARVFGEGYRSFEDRQAKVQEEQDEQARKIVGAVRREQRWLIRGVTARRKRNQRRLRELTELRERQKNELKRAGKAALNFAASTRKNKLVLEADGLSKRYENRWIIQNLGLRLIKGDRLAAVGPNGIGKSTLLSLLAKDLEPDAGTVRHGFQLKIAKLEQDSSSIDKKLTLRQFLAGRGVRDRDRVDQVWVDGRSRHIISYLQDFMFTKWQADAPVSSLSGGEMARLRLAKIMAAESDLLVLDEPTNDLDIESKDLLSDALDNYGGTVLYASHDRDFIDRTASITVAFESPGNCVPYAGGWSDRLSQMQQSPAIPSRDARKPKQQAGRAGRRAANAGLSFTESYRLNELEGEIAKMEQEVAQISNAIAKPELASEKPELLKSMLADLDRTSRALRKAEDEWLDLEERNEFAKKEN